MLKKTEEMITKEMKRQRGPTENLNLYKRINQIFYNLKILHLILRTHWVGLIAYWMQQKIGLVYAKKTDKRNHRKKKEIKRTEQNRRDICDIVKCSNICVIGVPEGQERDNGEAAIFEEITVKYFLKSDERHQPIAQIQEVQQTPSRINIKKTTIKYIIMKLLKTRDTQNQQSLLQKIASR